MSKLGVAGFLLLLAGCVPAGSSTIEDPPAMDPWDPIEPADPADPSEPVASADRRAIAVSASENVLEALRASGRVREACNYPADAARDLRFGQTMPKLSWPAAFDRAGMPYNFSLEDVHCSAEWSEVNVLIFVISAGWCPNCPDYMRGIAADVEELEAAGGRVVLVEAQDTSYRPADSADARAWVERIAGDNVAIAVGDSDVLPNAGVFYDSPLVTAFPTAFVVRRSDMKIIADQSRTNGVLPFVNIARHSELDWSDPDNVTIVNCGAAEEEASEPNDAIASAAELSAGTVEGGVCNSSADYYRIGLAGNYRVSLEFRHAVGDLDVYVWNEATGQAREEGGAKVGSYGAEDGESFEYSGPSLIRVEGYRGATAPYVLTLEALP